MIAAARGAPHARIVAVGAYRPERVVTNEQICRTIDSSDEWIRSAPASSPAAGRRRTRPSSTWPSSRRAQALDAAGLTGRDIDAVLVATVTHPYQTPVRRLAARPPARRHPGRRASTSRPPAPASATASALAGDMVRGGSAENVLVVGVEKLSDFTDLNDRGTGVHLRRRRRCGRHRPSDEPAIGPTVWGSDGAQWAAISRRTRGSSPGAGTPSSPTCDGRPGGVPLGGLAMAPVAQKALDTAGVPAKDLAAFIPHQANVRIIDAMAQAARAAGARRGRPRHRRDREHVSGVDPDGDGPPARARRGAARRPRAADRLRGRPDLRRPGRRLP